LKSAALLQLAAFFCGSATQVFKPPSINGEEGLMPARIELTMRQLRQMLRLQHNGVSVFRRAFPMSGIEIFCGFASNCSICDGWNHAGLSWHHHENFPFRHGTCRR
jgi:hypothetical protein